MKYEVELRVNRPSARIRRELLIVSLTALALLTVPAHAQIFTSLYSFPGGTAGAYPGNLTVSPSGTIFGGTQQGGDQSCNPPYGCGVIFKLSTNGTETVLHAFAGSGANDGSGPNGLLLNPSTGTLYGTTAGGGTASSSCVNGCGTVFKIDAGGRETILHRFTDDPDGNLPLGTPVHDPQGNLYGVTFYGGASSGQTGSGTVFKINGAGVETILHAFSTAVNGTNPTGSLVRDSAGNLYGTTLYGGTGSCNNGFLPGCGVVFKLDPSGNETVLHDFTGGKDSQYPSSLVLDASSGNLYGLAGYNGYGEIFRIDPAGNFTMLVVGTIPASMNSMILAEDGGGLIAPTTGGLSSCSGGCGTVLQFYPTIGYYNVILLTDFDGADGEYPVVLTESNDLIYGTTYQGGTYGYGTIYTLTP